MERGRRGTMTRYALRIEDGYGSGDGDVLEVTTDLERAFESKKLFEESYPRMTLAVYEMHEITEEEHNDE